MPSAQNDFINMSIFMSFWGGILWFPSGKWAGLKLEMIKIQGLFIPKFFSIKKVNMFYSKILMQGISWYQ